LPGAYNNVIPSVTYEGDNGVLLQQTAKFILADGREEDFVKPNQIVRDDDIFSVVQILKYVSAMEVKRLKKTLQKHYESGVG
jgi:hypothetical protein